MEGYKKQQSSEMENPFNAKVDTSVNVISNVSISSIGSLSELIDGKSSECWYEF